MLKQKWLQKGCNKQIIDDVLSQFDFSEIAIRVASKLLRKYQGKLPSKTLKEQIKLKALSIKVFIPRK